MEETLSVAGVDFRPFLTATTSMDGSIATTYQTGAQVVVCDSALSAALSSADTTVKIGTAGTASTGWPPFETPSGSCTRWPTTSPPKWSAWSRRRSARVAGSGSWRPTPGGLRGHRRREGLHPGPGDPPGAGRLTAAAWAHDGRVSLWRGTACGVVAAVNTMPTTSPRGRGWSDRHRPQARSSVSNMGVIDGRRVTNCRPRFSCQAARTGTTWSTWRCRGNPRPPPLAITSPCACAVASAATSA